jgi:DMSO reductase family type II enzyme chaperone
MAALEAIESKPITTKKEESLAARSRFYSLLAEAFRYPDEEFRQQARQGELKQAFAVLSGSLPYEFAVDENLTLPAGLNNEDLDVDFIRLFDAGPGNPPCPLVEGLYKEDRKTVFKELILFYNNFGLSYAEGSMEDRPDHITYEMEFLHYLAFLTLTAEQRGADAMGYLRAQRDFLERHPVQWMNQMAARIEDIRNNLREDANRDVVKFYHDLIHLAHRFVVADFEYLRAALAH